MNLFSLLGNVIVRNKTLSVTERLSVCSDLSQVSLLRYSVMKIFDNIE